MSKARNLANIADDVSGGVASPDQLGRRNLIINGGFDVWQRNTSQTANGYFSADRWFMYGNTHGATMQRGTDAPDGFTYALTTSGTPTGDIIINQAIELPATGKAGMFYGGNTITVSWYAKSTDATDQLYALMVFRDTTQSATNQVLLASSGSNSEQLSTEWQRFTWTFTIDPSNVPSATNTGCTLTIRSLGYANGNISITGVQVEVGDTATPFEHRSYGEELALCQRYMYPINMYNNGYFGMGWHYNDTNLKFPVRLPNTMRAIPTIVQSVVTGEWRFYRSSGYDELNTTFTIDGGATPTFVQMYPNDASGSAGVSGGFYCNGNSSYIYLESEL